MSRAKDLADVIYRNYRISNKTKVKVGTFIKKSCKKGAPYEAVLQAACTKFNISESIRRTHEIQ